jgi:hypothetical protein
MIGRTFSFARRHFRFSLRSILIVVAIMAIFFAYLSVQIKRAKEQKAGVEAIQRLGGWVHYDFDYDGTQRIKNAKSWVPDWILKRVGIDLFHNVVEINMFYNDDGPKRLNNENVTDEIKNHLDKFPNLKLLYVVKTQATDDLIEKASVLTRLERIGIWHATLITPKGTAALKKIPSLKHVNILYSHLTDESLKNIGELHQLKKLYVFRNQFTDIGLSYLKNLDQLEILDIKANNDKVTVITDTGVKYLEGLKNLKELYIVDADVTPEGIQRLREAIPQLKIIQ